MKWRKLELPLKYDYRKGDYFIREWFLKIKKFYLKNYI